MMTPRRILLVQTQAENAGAQEITRILGQGLTERGHDVANLFGQSVCGRVPRRHAGRPALTEVVTAGWRLAKRTR